ncbi:MAG: type VI secretion system accessory protein TagJ [Planctomycetota bacterium]
MKAEELVKEGRLDDALAALQDTVRDAPARADLRVFLFQLLSVMGRWDRALTQLNVAAELDSKNLLMAQVCRAALQCEALRAEVFAGKRTPLVLGEPQPWVGRLVESLRMRAQGHHPQADDLRDQAFEDAPASPGFVDQAPFEWLADLDDRLGPCFEAIVEGRYYWVPMANVASLDIDPPADLRDTVWSPVRFTWTNGGDAIALMPVRYPGSETSTDDALRAARKTEWVGPEDAQTPAGQRMWATPDDERSMLATRRVVFGTEWTEAQLPGDDEAQPADGTPADG